MWVVCAKIQSAFATYTGGLERQAGRLGSCEPKNGRHYRLNNEGKQDSSGHAFSRMGQAVGFTPKEVSMTYFRRSITLGCHDPSRAPGSRWVSAQCGADRPGDQALDRQYEPSFISKYALNEKLFDSLLIRARFSSGNWNANLIAVTWMVTSQERRANQLSVEFRQASETLHSLYAVRRVWTTAPKKRAFSCSWATTLPNLSRTRLCRGQHWNHGMPWTANCLS